MNNKKFYFVVFFLLTAFAALSVSGCGGGSSSNSPVGSSSQFTVLDDDIFDTDGDRTPDILDFDDIEQKYYGENDPSQDIKISSIPSLHYLRNAKNGASFVADLTAGIEYTFEISESAGISGTTEAAPYAYPIGINFPDVKITNPQGTALEFLSLGTFDENHDSSAVIELKDDFIELSMYPYDNPYMICLTFTPSVTGSYKINFSRTGSETSASDETDDFEHIPTLFIYKELRSGTDKNEAGYYKIYKFRDSDGNYSDTVNMTDIMELRKGYYSALYDTLSTALQYNELTDDWLKTPADQDRAYLASFYHLRPYYGIFEGVDTSNNETEIVSGEIIIKEDDPEEQVYADDADVVSVAATAKELSKSGGIEIKERLYGFPYKEDAFAPGTGYFALTGIRASAQAVSEFKIKVPDIRRQVISKYRTSFVSSQQDREDLSKAMAAASVSIGGFGVSADYSSEGKFKFGLTSTTFVIHYEELEHSYRELDYNDYDLTDTSTRIAGKDLDLFRNRYGDYFVSGYKYGGTFDAFISITTEKIKQLDNVKAALSANFKSPEATADAGIGISMKDMLEQNKATVSIQIRTAGIDKSGLNIPSETSDISDIATSFKAFREKFKNTDPKYYQPAYAMLRRYTSLVPIEIEMLNQNYGNLLPVTPEHSAKIMTFNKERLELDSAYNVVIGLKDNQMDSSVKNQYKDEYKNINYDIDSGGNNFFAESNSENMNKMQKKMADLRERLRATGDRYVFYQLLMAEQEKEMNYRPQSITDKPFGPGGGSIGFETYLSSKAVQSDIAEGMGFFDEKNERPVFIGTHHTWRPNFRAEIYDRDHRYEAIFHHIVVESPNIYDLNRDVMNSPCIGKNTANFYFQSGGTRWAEWKIRLHSMRFNKTLYPFNGLK